MLQTSSRVSQMQKNQHDYVKSLAFCVMLMKNRSLRMHSWTGIMANRIGCSNHSSTVAWEICWETCSEPGLLFLRNIYLIPAAHTDVTRLEWKMPTPQARDVWKRRQFTPSIPPDSQRPLLKKSPSIISQSIMCQDPYVQYENNSEDAVNTPI